MRCSDIFFDQSVRRFGSSVDTCSERVATLDMIRDDHRQHLQGLSGHIAAPAPLWHAATLLAPCVAERRQTNDRHAAGRREQAHVAVCRCRTDHPCISIVLWMTSMYHYWLENLYQGNPVPVF